MTTSQELNYTVGTIGSALGLIVCIILIVIKNEGSISRKLLSGVIFSLSLFSLSNALVGTQFYLRNPHAFRLAAPFSGLMPAMLYLYVRSVLYAQFKLRSKDYLFAVPAILLLIDFFPFYMLSGEEKRVIITQMKINTNLALIEIDGWFPNGFGMVIRSTTGLYFNLLALFKVYQHKKRSVLNEVNDETQSDEMYKWLYFLLISMLGLYILLITWNFLAVSSTIAFFVVISFASAGFIFVISIYLFFNPKILYGLQGWLDKPYLLSQVVIKSQPPSMDLSTPPKTTVFTNKMRTEMRFRIESHFKSNKPFIVVGYKIKDLSKELNIPIYLISSFINQEYGKNFNEFVNEHRVEHVADILKKSPDGQQFTLEAVAKSAGFNSRNTFIAAVKKKSGMTPSVYFSRAIT